jgi:hypothetical protein
LLGGLILISFCDCFVLFPDLSVIFYFGYEVPCSKSVRSWIALCFLRSLDLFSSSRFLHRVLSALDFCFTRRSGFCSFSYRSSGPVCVWLAYAPDFPAAVEVFVRPKVVPSVVRCCCSVWTEAEICLCGFFFLVFMCFVGSPSCLEVAVQKYEVFVLCCSVSVSLSRTKNCPLAAVLFLVKLMICCSASSVLLAWPFSPLRVLAPVLTAA